VTTILRMLFWTALAILGAVALATIALHRGEPINATWFVLAAGCCYLVAYRLYSAFIAARLLALDNTRATPSERREDGRDFVPTNKWVLFGHHFAAIAGPGPLVGPTLAAQFGYLPGTLWLIAGAAFAGCVQDFVILFCSIRRDGKTLGEMARTEVSRRGGFIAQLAVLAIMIILLGVVALVVVNALKSSPWATFTLAMTIPIALLLGVYLRYFRPGRVLEASIIGVALIVFAVVAGQWIADSPSLASKFTLGGVTLAFAIIAYGFAASALPVWLLLAPRDYLSSFIKAGAIFTLAAGILLVRPQVLMPPLTRFVDGSGPVFAGKVFPFCFITIACGAISGFHSLISSGTTPKMIQREGHARFIGYGAMLLESFVGVMAMVAACAMTPGVYFAINSPATIVGATPEAAAQTISSWGYPLSAATMTGLAHAVGEQTLLNRAGGAPSLAVGMAQIFSSTIGGERLLSIWYHFAIMFEALFILTVLDAGTRVGRFMIQELGGRVWKPLGRMNWVSGDSALQRNDCRRVGLLFVSRSGRPAGRNQLAVAAVRNCESAFGRCGAGGRDYHFAEDGSPEMDLGDAGPHRLAGSHHHDRELPENLQPQSAYRLPLLRECTGGSNRRRKNSSDETHRDAAPDFQSAS
jgi:carbon starvation protein